MDLDMSRHRRIMVCPLPDQADLIVASGKKPLSSSCPYIVENDQGEVVLSGGAAGGSTIISSNIQVARNVLVSPPVCLC
jgi:gamma-glutamyltranspeptidase